MKKYLSILLVVLLALVAAGCGTAPAEGGPAAAPPENNPATSSSPPPASTSPSPAPSTPPETPVETPDETPPEDEAGYTPYAIQFKNKTGVEMTGLYLYESGSADKGVSLCPDSFPDADVDKDASMILTYVVRPTGATCDLYVEWVDGTSATLAGQTIINHDKFSMKGGVDPAGWEHEPMDNAGEIAEIDAIVAAGRTTDNFYGDYAVIPLELKNKTGKEITGYYFYEAGADPHKYGNILDYVLVPAVLELENLFPEDLIPIEVPWPTGGGTLNYIFTFFVRPVAAEYELLVEFVDGTTLVIPEIDVFTLNAAGVPINEVSMKDAYDPWSSPPKYDDGDPEPLQYLIDAVKYGGTGDGWYPVF